MKITWLDTREGITLVAEEGYVRVANPVELELRRQGMTLVSFLAYLLGDTPPPQSVMDAMDVFAGEPDDPLAPIR